MEIRELINHFEKTCHTFCKTTRKRTLEFNLKNEVRISFHINLGLILYTVENDWNIGKKGDQPEYGKTSESVIKALINEINSGLIDRREIEKHIISIT